MTNELSYIVIAVVTSIIGSIIRIVKEKDGDKEIARSKITAIIFCSIMVGYLIEGVALFLCREYDANFFAYLGHVSIIGGVASLEIVDTLIIHIPDLLKGFLTSLRAFIKAKL